jgi:S-adenosylmethionine:tRNA ribosyltransferase-isomerase
LAPDPDLDAFDYPLPRARIAQHPAPERDAARLLVLARGHETLEHAHVRDLARFLRAGDLLVWNATRVLPARLRGRKRSGGRAEALLLGPVPGEPGRFRALLRVSGRVRPGLALELGDPEKPLLARVLAVAEDGAVELLLAADALPYAAGEMPLPPYIRRERPDALDFERYQTVFAREPGSVAAPTAGLHLTAALLERLRGAGIETAELVLQVGPGTFRPLRAADLARRTLPPEAFDLPEETAAAIRRTRARGGRVVAVGTTTTRVLESRHAGGGLVTPGSGSTDLFLLPGSRFAVVDALLTNFHLPRSSLLLLVAAFAGRERVLAAYAAALGAGYRFYSYGDAMLILP